MASCGPVHSQFLWSLPLNQTFDIVFMTGTNQYKFRFLIVHNNCPSIDHNGPCGMCILWKTRGTDLLHQAAVEIFPYLIRIINWTVWSGLLSGGGWSSKNHNMICNLGRNWKIWFPINDLCRCTAPWKINYCKWADEHVDPRYTSRGMMTRECDFDGLSAMFIHEILIKWIINS